MPGDTSGYSGARERKAERRNNALALRVRGFSYSEIGKEIGVAKSVAYKYVADTLDKLAERDMANAEELRQLELERLDFAARSISEQVRNGDIKAVNSWVNISESRRRLLGIDRQVLPFAGDAPAITINMVALPGNEPERKVVGATDGTNEDDIIAMDVAAETAALH